MLERASTHRRFRALEQFSGFDAGCFCRDFSRDIPVSDAFAFAQRGASKREPDTIISETKTFAASATQFGASHSGRLGSYQSVLSMNGERIIIPLRR